MRHSRLRARGSSPGCQGALLPSGRLTTAKTVDDAGGGRVSVCESLLDAGDSTTAGSQAAAEYVAARGMFGAKHHRQQRPVHSAVFRVGCRMHWDGVRRVGEVSVESLVVVAGGFVALSMSSW